MPKYATPAIAIACATAFGLLATTAPALAQGVQQTVPIARIDVEKLATGYRVSKVIGSDVVNRSGQLIGTVDEIIAEPGDSAPVAILSVGGFLGIGEHLVAVPMKDLKISKDRIELPDATKEGLKALPQFKYASS
jgi:PRC-barrel domain.